MMHFSSSSFCLLLAVFFICEGDAKAQDENRILTITAKSYITELYVDDIKVRNLINEARWNRSDDVDLSPHNRLISVTVTDTSYSCAGILASVTGDYLVTDVSWRCSEQTYPQWYVLGFDDSSWSDAFVIGKNGNVTTPSECNILTEIPSISSNASWIWTASIANAPVYDSIVFCRGYLPLCDESPCRSGGTCLRNDPQICSCPLGYFGTYCELANPLNVAALAGETVVMICMHPSTNVTWWFTTVGSDISSVIVSDCQVLPEFTSQYTVDKNDGACNLVIFSVNLSLAGTYACQETSNPDAYPRASGELTVLSGMQQCLPSPNPVVYGQNITITCDLSYSGNWAPTIRWIDRYGQAVTNDTTVITSSNISSYIQIPAFFPSVPYFTTITYFTELILPNITGVVRANNTPSSIYVVPTQVVDVVCPVGFFKTTHNHCYTLLPEKSYCDVARDRCLQLYPGAYLIVISDYSEQIDVIDYLDEVRPNDYIWIGAYSSSGCYNHTWQPIPGYSLPMIYKNYRAGQPDCWNGFQPCMMIDFNTPYYGWMDHHCDVSFIGFCEFELTIK